MRACVCHMTCMWSLFTGYRPLNITYSYDGNRWQQVHPYKSVDCIATGGPGPVTLKWRYRGNVIHDYGRIHVKDVPMGNYTVLRLVLDSALPGIDSGLYTCVADNEWQEPVERSLNIIFTVNSKCSCWLCTSFRSCLGDTGIYIAYWPKSVIAIQGSNVSVDCYTVSSITAVNSGSVVFQLANSNSTRQDWPHEGLNDFVFRSTMSIYNVRPSDAGVYECSVVGLWNGATKATNLTVISGSSYCIVVTCQISVVTDPLHIVSLEHPNTTYISCNVTVHPLLDNHHPDISVIIWWHSDTSKPKKIYSQQTNVNNTIEVATNVDDSGVYECRASIDNFVTTRNVSVTISSGVVGEDGGADYLAVLAAVAVLLILFLVMCIVIMFCLVYRHSNKASSSHYSNMVSRTRIGARLSTNSCDSADFVIKKSSVSCHVTTIVCHCHPM